MLYIGTNEGKGFTAEEIERGLHWIHADIKCGHCGKEQPIAATGYLGGPCVRCHQPTIGCCKGTCEGSAK